MARKQGSYSGTTGPKIREAAAQLIARDGYAAVSMRQIAAQVGVQAGALYNYTADKQSLLYDMMRAHMTDLSAALAEQNWQGNAGEQLEAFTRFHIRFHLPRRDDVFISYMELRNLRPENFDRIEEMRRAYEDALEKILILGESEGRFSVPDTRIATLGLIALLTGICNWYREDGRLSLVEIEETYVSLVRKSVKAD